MLPLAESSSPSLPRVTVASDLQLFFSLTSLSAPNELLGLQSPGMWALSQAGWHQAPGLAGCALGAWPVASCPPGPPGTNGQPHPGSWVFECEYVDLHVRR